MSKHTDVYHITVAGMNPHEIAEALNNPDSPFYDPSGNGGVVQHIMKDGQIVGGIVDVWAPEHLSAEQERRLADCPHVIDVRHHWPK